MSKGKLAADEIAKDRIASTGKTSPPSGGHDDRARGKNELKGKPKDITFGPPGGSRTPPAGRGR